MSLPDDGAGLYVPVSIDIEVSDGTPDQLVEQLIAERNNHYPEWEFDGRVGIIIHSSRTTHVSIRHTATATLTKMVRYRGPQPGD